MVRIATIINTHALKGECKLYLHTDDPATRFLPWTIFTLDTGERLKLKRFRMQKGFGYAMFEDVDTVEKAQALKGRVLELSEEELGEPGEGEYYYHQLADSTVFNTEGTELGQVSDLLETGANLVLRVGQGKAQFLVPFVDAFIEEVDVTGKRIVIREMEGLR